MGSRAWAQQLRCIGVAPLWHVESFQTRDQTCVPCTGREILNPWTTREVLHEVSLSEKNIIYKIVCNKCDLIFLKNKNELDLKNIHNLKVESYVLLGRNF